ncbi:MAG: hypothetical protein ACK5PQ_00775 [Alphaproteobacteria bacterium]
MVSVQRVNFGPYHPSIKGMVRFVLELEGETIQKGTCYAGFTHRGLEKILEAKPFIKVQKILENADKNFLTPFSFSYAFALGMETLQKEQAPVRGQFSRVILAELGRIFCHLNQIAAISESIDFHLISSWALNLVEELDGLFIALSDTHKVHIVPGGISAELSLKLLQEIRALSQKINQDVSRIKNALLHNAIFKLRATQVGVVSEVEAMAWGLSGPILRASRIGWDLRKAKPYDIYTLLDFKIPVGAQGDSFERTAVRIEEIFQSVSIICQCVELMPREGEVNSFYNAQQQGCKGKGLSTEAMITHYKFFTGSVPLKSGQPYVAIEGARGELGLFLSYHEGMNTFDRVRLRTPSFFNLQTLEALIKGHMFSDLPLLFNSFDIYSAEVDR